VNARGRGRALVAIGLFLGFYVLGAVVVCALLVLPWAQEHYEGGVSLSGILCGIAAVSVGIGMIPRFPKPDLPGRRLTATEHPRLHEFIRKVADAVGAKPPDALYLLPTANAFASTIRPSRFSLRRYTVVGLGLPLFASLEEDELACVVAHEFGHHIGGEVAWGPWLYGARLAIGTALERLDGSAFWLHLPFVAYGNLFLRLTRPTSREQELSADRLSASHFGAAPTATALLRVHEIDLTWDAYWDGEVIPVLERSMLPKVLDGYARFTEEIAKRPKVRADLEAAKREGRSKASKPLDTHPSLRERLEALGTPDAASRRGGRSSMHLFDDPAHGERAAIESILKNPALHLEPFEWDAAAEKVWVPLWTDVLAPHKTAFESLTPSALPTVIANASAWAQRLRQGIAILSPEAERKRVARLCGTWLAVTLHDRRFVLHCPPGAEPYVAQGERVLQPFTQTASLAEGTMTATEWQALCAEFGLP